MTQDTQDDSREKHGIKGGTETVDKLRSTLEEDTEADDE